MVNCGTRLAQIMKRDLSASLFSLPCASAETISNMRRPRNLAMKDLQKILASAFIFSVLSVSALAGEPQKDQRQPPPKDPKVFDKKEKPPREDRRENRDKPKEDKRGKPGD